MGVNFEAKEVREDLYIEGERERWWRKDIKNISQQQMFSFYVIVVIIIISTGLHYIPRCNNNS